MLEAVPNIQQIEEVKKGSFEPLILSTKERFDVYWPEIAPMIDKCMHKATHGELTLQDIYDRCTSGHMNIFVVKDDSAESPEVPLVLVTELVNYPRLTALRIVALGGTSLDKYYGKFWTKFCGWAYMNGVRAIEGLVSPAMERIISRYGFEHVYTHMRLDLTED